MRWLLLSTLTSAWINFVETEELHITTAGHSYQVQKLFEPLQTCWDKGHSIKCYSFVVVNYFVCFCLFCFVCACARACMCVCVCFVVVVAGVFCFCFFSVLNVTVKHSGLPSNVEDAGHTIPLYCCCYYYPQLFLLLNQPSQRWRQSQQTEPINHNRDECYSLRQWQYSVMLYI